MLLGLLAVVSLNVLLGKIISADPVAFCAYLLMLDSKPVLALAQPLNKLYKFDYSFVDLIINDTLKTQWLASSTGKVNTHRASAHLL